ncbi:JAB domain-containing protein [Chloroflexota bacterium]
MRGIGLAKATQIKAAFELANRLEGYSELGKKPVVKTPGEVVSLVRGRLKGKKKEHFLALLLDTRGQLIRISEISVGSLDTSIVHLSFLIYPSFALSPIHATLKINLCLSSSGSFYR